MSLPNLHRVGIYRSRTLNMSTTEVKTPTSISRSRLGAFSPPQRVLRPDLESKVRVVIRVRPFLPVEIEAAKGKPKSCLTITKANGHLEREDTLLIKDMKTSRNESYKLDWCYGQEDDVRQIFSREVDPILPGLFRGSNATVFAYGATGSGKTYTMQGTNETPGIMPLAMSSIITMAENTESRVEISYYEVYMDRCYDLLEPKNKEVPVLEDSEGRVQLRGLAQVRVNSLEEFQEVFNYGCLRRKVGHTGLNDVSSRSHGVLMVSVSSDDGNPDMPLVGKLNLIDLAGNEDNRRTGNEGLRLTESVRINQSLFALSNVIHALNANENRVPYRDSKLTRILQDSLGGTSRSLMIACLNPISYQEALHTVSLAARSRQIVNHVAMESRRDTPRPKVDMNARLNAWLETKSKNNCRVAKPGSPSVGRLISPLSSRLTPHGSTTATANSNFSTPKGRKFLGPPGRVKVTSSEESPQINSSKAGEHAGSEMAASDCQPDDYKKINTPSKTIQSQEIGQADSEAPIASEPNNITLPSDVAKECSDKENRVVKELIFDDSSPPLSVRLKQLRSALTEMLTPQNSNVERYLPANVTPCSKPSGMEPFQIKQILPMTTTPSSIPCGIPAEPNTPRTPQVEHRVGKEETSQVGTPLERFSARGSGLKKSLTRDYLSFLNTASREELLELRGIGEKRANDILELRQRSPEPLKELQDLEKIGLSSKQIKTIFNSTARQILS